MLATNYQMLLSSEPAKSIKSLSFKMDNSNPNSDKILQALSIQQPI